MISSACLDRLIIPFYQSTAKGSWTSTQHISMMIILMCMTRRRRGERPPGVTESSMKMWLTLPTKLLWSTMAAESQSFQIIDQLVAPLKSRFTRLTKPRRQRLNRSCWNSSSDHQTLLSPLKVHQPKCLSLKGNSHLITLQIELKPFKYMKNTSRMKPLLWINC
jgi:hypothetical protein